VGNRSVGRCEGLLIILFFCCDVLSGRLSILSIRYLVSLQKRVIRMVVNLEVRDSCRCAFKELGILPLYLQYLYFLLLFVVRNISLFYANNDDHTFDTRYRYDLHLPFAKMKIFHRGTFIQELELIIIYQTYKELVA